MQITLAYTSRGYMLKYQPTVLTIKRRKFNVALFKLERNMFRELGSITKGAHDAR